MSIPIYLGKSDITVILYTRSLERLIEMVDEGIKQDNLARMCRCVGLARIERDRLFDQEIDPATDEPFDSATAYFARPEVMSRFGISPDRRKRSYTIIQGRALLEAHIAGVIDLNDFDPTGHWEKLKLWSKAIDRHGDAAIIMKNLLSSPTEEFEAFARGKVLSSRLDTPPKRLFQKYFLGLYGSYKVSHE